MNSKNVRFLFIIDPKEYKLESELVDTNTNYIIHKHKPELFVKKKLKRN